MAFRYDRGMNRSLSVGAVDGKVRFLRPDADDCDESHAQLRAQQLHTAHYGSMGISQDSLLRIHDARYDASLRQVF